MKNIALVIILFLATSLIPKPEISSEKLCQAAIEQTYQKVTYDASYFSIPYPNGDVPSDKGVCTDVVIRAYRKLGIDLQKEVHEDMLKNFSLYPKTWKQSKPDANIDHRRVPNLMVFFSRKGEVKKISDNPIDYKPGDLVTWDLGGGMTHISIIIPQKSVDGNRCLLVHNIGRGQEISDCLFQFKIIGHYRYRV